MPTIKELATQYQDQYPAEEGLFLDFSGWKCLVKSNSKDVIAKLRNYFRDFLADGAGQPDVTVHALEAPSPDPAAFGEFSVKQPDPGKKKIKEESMDLADGRIVRKRLTGMIFFFGSEDHFAVGPCLENDNQVVNFINNRFIAHHLDTGSLLFHAAGIAKADTGAGMAMAGFSGMGKSTLALHIMNLGTDFVSNDRLMVRKDGAELTMYGVAKMPRINPGTILHNERLSKVITNEERCTFEALPKEELWDLEHKYDAFIDECYGPGKYRLSAPMKALVLLNWKRTDEPVQVNAININERDDLMPAFMKSSGLFYGQPGSPALFKCEPALYRELLAGCPVYELTGGADFERAAELCMDLV